MLAASTHEVTQLLTAWNQGDQTALEQLIPLVYRHLRTSAGRMVAHVSGFAQRPAVARYDWAGIVLFDVTTQRYERLTYEGDSPYGLPDSRRLLYVHKPKVYWLDSETKITREVLAHAEETLAPPAPLTRWTRSVRQPQ